jgi:hypothetical protein
VISIQEDNDAIRKYVTYTPQGMISKLLAISVGRKCDIKVTTPAKSGISFHLGEVMSRQDACERVLLAHVLVYAKLANCLVKGVSMMDGGLYLPFPRLFSLSPDISTIRITLVMKPETVQAYNLSVFSWTLDLLK